MKLLDWYKPSELRKAISQELPVEPSPRTPGSMRFPGESPRDWVYAGLGALGCVAVVYCLFCL